MDSVVAKENGPMSQNKVERNLLATMRRLQFRSTTMYSPMVIPIQRSHNASVSQKRRSNSLGCLHGRLPSIIILVEDSSTTNTIGHRRRRRN